MKVRAQISMVLNLDKCIGCGMNAPPTPVLPATGRRKGCDVLIETAVGEQL